MATVRVTAAGETASVTYTPPVAGFPNASTTGARGTLKAYTGSYALTSTVAAPVILDGYAFSNGDLVVSGPGIIIRNCKFTSGTYWPLRVTGTAASPALITDCTFVTGGQSQCSVAIEQYGTVQRCDVSGSADGIRGADDSKAVDNYVHDLFYSGSEHNDGIDFEGTKGNMIVRHNTVIVKPGETSCITVTRYSGTSTFDNVLVDNNLLSGAGYCIYGPGTSNGPVTNNRITNNRFSKVLAGNFPKYGGFGWMAYEPPTGAKFPSNVISGNVDHETGVLLN